MTKKNVLSELKAKTITLKKLYTQKLKPALQLREDLRKDIKRLYIFMFLGVGIFISFFIIAAILMEYSTLLFSLIASTVFFIAWVSYVIVVHREKYERYFQTHVLSPTLALIDKTWILSPDKRVSTIHYIKSNLLYLNYSEIGGGYLLKGRIGKTDFECSTLMSRYGDGDSTKTVFDGLFFHADFHKHFKHRTYVICKYENTEKSNDIIFNRHRASNLVKMESPEFNRHFKVYSTSQQEARYIITPALMEGMLNLIKTYRIEMHFSFCNSRVYCAIHQGQWDIFEAPINKIMSYRDIYRIYSFLYLNKIIVAELDLNTRIWTKE